MIIINNISLIALDIGGTLLSDSNLILVCSKDVDKFIACNYIREFVKNQSVEIINNLEDDLKYSMAQRVIVPEPSLSDVIKIFKYIIEGSRTFVFGINLKTDIKVLESIKILILTECPNLSEKNVEHIIAVSSSLILNVVRNEDGLFEITRADKVFYENNELVFEELNIIKRRDEISDNTNINITNNDEIDNIQLSEEIETYNILDEDKDIEPAGVIKKPLNKYKILREKIRKKKELT